MTTPLTAYQLPRNPFQCEALNPFASDDDYGRLSLLDGWKNLDVEAGDLMDKKITDQGPAHFVLVGVDKSGRTSIANYLMRLWSDKRGGKDAVYDIRHGTGPNAGTYSIKSSMTEWAQNFLPLNIRDNLRLSGTTLGCLRGLSEDNWNPELMAEALVNLELDFRNPRENGRERFLAAIFEHGRGDELVMKIKNSFKHTQALVVTTIDGTTDSDDLVSNIGADFDGLVLKLRPIQGADVWALISHQWERVGQGVQNPFEQDAVEKVFNSPRPIGRVVNMLAWLLDDLNAAHLVPGVAPWPATKTLGIREGVLQTHVSRYESQLNWPRRQLLCTLPAIPSPARPLRRSRARPGTTLAG